MPPPDIADFDPLRISVLDIMNPPASRNDALGEKTGSFVGRVTFENFKSHELLQDVFSTMPRSSVPSRCKAEAGVSFASKFSQCIVLR